MHWSNYVAAFFAGAILMNAIPHGVKGVCGDRFPTPFAKPPGKGLSSPTVNFVWALLNLVVGYVLYCKGGIAGGDRSVLVVFFVGMAVLGTLMSVRFASKHTS